MMSEPLDVRSYYARVTAIDIVEVAHLLLGSRIHHEDHQTLFVDCPRHASLSHTSLHIWRNRQGWYCHGCGVGGDVLQLVEFIRTGTVTRGCAGMMPDSHREARDWLAERVGLPPLAHIGLSPEEITRVERERAHTVRAYEVLSAVTAHYTDSLLMNPAALAWVNNQYAFDEEVIRVFGIGYAENYGIIKALQSQGFTLEELCASAAFRPDAADDTCIYPTFAGRVIFPYYAKGQVVYLIGRKTPWTPNEKWEEGKYRKLPVNDPGQRPWIAPGIENNVLYNEELLTTRPTQVIITEGITDCIALIRQGFPAISPVTVSLRKDDWARLQEKLHGVRDVVLCQDNEISEAGWRGAIRTAEQLSAAGLSCRIATLPLDAGQEHARQLLADQYQVHPGDGRMAFTTRLASVSQEEREQAQQWLEQAKQDVCSYFVGGHTAHDFQQVIDDAFSPVEYAIHALPEGMRPTQIKAVLPDILTQIARQPPVEETSLLRALQERLGKDVAPMSDLRSALRAVKRTKAHSARTTLEHAANAALFTRGKHSYYLVDNGIVQESVRDLSDGPLVTRETLTNFHIRISGEEVYDDGELRDDGTTIGRTIMSGEIIGPDWREPFRIEGSSWGRNAELASAITERVGKRAFFLTRETDLIRCIASCIGDSTDRRVVYPVYGIHPTAGFVSPTITVRHGEIITTARTGATVDVGSDYAKARRLDLAWATESEVVAIVTHLLTDYVGLQPHAMILPILAHAFLGPLLFGTELLGEFSPFILFLAGSSGRGKTETARLAQCLWGEFYTKEHLAAWGSTPEMNRQEGARCRGALWLIDDFKRQKIGQLQWMNAVRVLTDYADLQARKRATPGAKVVTGSVMRCMLMVTGEDLPFNETAALARSLIVDFAGEKRRDQYRACLARQREYRKVPPYYLAWLQRQDADFWMQRTREYIDYFTGLLDFEGLTTDNSQRLSSNAALSMVGLEAFLMFAHTLGVDTHALCGNLIDEYAGILEEILRKMVGAVDVGRPGVSFIGLLMQLLAGGRVRILHQYVPEHDEHGVPVIGYRSADGRSIFLLTSLAMGTPISWRHCSRPNNSWPPARDYRRQPSRRLRRNWRSNTRCSSSNSHQ